MGIAYESSVPRKVRFNWISEAWGLFSAQAVVWLASALITGLGIAIISNVLNRLLVPTVSFGGYGSGIFRSPFAPILAMYTHVGFWVSWLVTQAATAFFVSGLVGMANNQVKGLPISIGDLFNGGPIFVRMSIYHILSALVSGIAYALCFFPGLFVSALIWPGYALVADGADPGSAYTRGSEPMKKDLLMGVVFVLVFFLIVVVSAVPCGLGLLVTLPMGILISSLMYRDMIGGLATANSGVVYAGTPTAPNAWPPAPAAAPETAPPPSAAATPEAETPPPPPQDLGTPPNQGTTT